MDEYEIRAFEWATLLEKIKRRPIRSEQYEKDIKQRITRCRMLSRTYKTPIILKPRRRR